ncbi:MAG: hypothetical protein K0R94_688 [Burkholderiales bacterium]|jgi:hypothetical protein|nr:hypothetical protein [Burkholderiales bacterium]
MLKLVYIILIFFYASHVWSDCTFNITNYADTPLVVEAGFYKGPSTTATVGIASSKIIKIKNDLSCNAVSNTGLGVTYLKLVSKKSVGSWVYMPLAKMIQGIGQSRISQNTVAGIAPSGEQLVLFNNLRPGPDSFEVRVEKAGRNISRQLGSMN